MIGFGVIHDEVMANTGMYVYLYLSIRTLIYIFAYSYILCIYILCISQLIYMIGFEVIHDEVMANAGMYTDFYWHLCGIKKLFYGYSIVVYMHKYKHMYIG
jgi:hypothetical protein